jgi:signal transduction histidine kinase
MRKFEKKAITQGLWVIAIVANCLFPWGLELLDNHFKISIAIVGMATAIHESLCSLLIFFLLPKVALEVKEKRWFKYLQYSFLSVAIADFAFGVTTYIIRIPPPRGNLPLWHEIPYAAFMVLAAMALVMRALQNLKPKGRMIAIATITIIGVAYFYWTYQFILHPFLGALPKRPIALYTTAFIYGAGQSVALGALFLLSLRVLSWSELSICISFLILFGTDFALRYIDMGNHVPKILPYEFGWEFSLAIIAGVTLLAKLRAQFSLLSEERLAPFHSIRTLLSGVTLTALLALSVVSYLIGSSFKIVNSTTVSLYVVLFATIWACANIVSLWICNNLQKVYGTLSETTGEVEEIGDSLTWEVKNIFNVLNNKNKEIKDQRDTFIRVTSKTTHSVKNAIFTLKTAIPHLAKNIGRDCGCFAANEGAFESLDLTLKGAEITLSMLLEERKRIQMPDLLGPALQTAVSTTSINFPNKKVILDLAPAVDLQRMFIGLSNTLTNLITNAAQASPDDAEIKIKVHGDGALLKIDISDRGQGITHDLLERLMRGEEITTKLTGNGLGVSSVVDWAKENNHLFDLNNNPDGGITASLILS